MSPCEANERILNLDENGFLKDPEIWDEAVARALALREEIPDLTERHWKVINFVREYYLQFGVVPGVSRLRKATAFTLKELYELFPSGPVLLVGCKLAGLPKPTGSV